MTSFTHVPVRRRPLIFTISNFIMGPFSIRSDSMAIGSRTPYHFQRFIWNFQSFDMMLVLLLQTISSTYVAYLMYNVLHSFHTDNISFRLYLLNLQSIVACLHFILLNILIQLCIRFISSITLDSFMFRQWFGTLCFPQLETCFIFEFTLIKRYIQSNDFFLKRTSFLFICERLKTFPAVDHFYSCQFNLRLYFNNIE